MQQPLRPLSFDDMLVPLKAQLIISPHEETKSSIWQDFDSFSDTSTKSLVDKVLKAIGILGWTVCYIAIVLAHQHTEFSLVWGHSLAYNLVWEFARTFVWNKGDDAWLTWLFGIGWFGIDILLFVKFWTCGDGTTSLNLNQERVVFLAFLALFSLISYFVNSMGESASRLWRHCSYTWGSLFQIALMSFILKGNTLPFALWMLYGAAFGNLAYMLSVRGTYEEWYSVRKHPVRFVMIVTQFIPNIAISILGVCMPLVMDI